MASRSWYLSTRRETPTNQSMFGTRSGMVRVRPWIMLRRMVRYLGSSSGSAMETLPSAFNLFPSAVLVV